MILADTSIWIDYFRGGSEEMRGLLDRREIVTHPWVVAELALGSLRDRAGVLGELDKLRKVQVAGLREVRVLIESRSLYGRGIGLTDAHLIASCLLTAGSQLWTRDKALALIARDVNVLKP